MVQEYPQSIKAVAGYKETCTPTAGPPAADPQGCIDNKSLGKQEISDG